MRQCKIYCEPMSLGCDPEFDLYLEICERVFAEQGYVARVFPFAGTDDRGELSEDEFGDLLRECWERYVCDPGWPSAGPWGLEQERAEILEMREARG